MSLTILSHSRENANPPFDTTISVAGCEVQTATLAGGNEPDEHVVTLTMPDRHFAFTWTAAEALIAAMQTVLIASKEDAGLGQVAA